jgi:DNA-binding response OmpR family regulator
MLEPVLDHAPRDSAPMPTGMALDPVGLTVRWQSRTATLTPREYAVLHCLLSRAGTPVSIARLQAHAWGDELPSQSASQIVTVYIHQLRRKLASVGLGQAIATVRNFGYVFAPPAGAGAGASEPTAGGASPASRPER